MNRPANNTTRPPSIVRSYIAAILIGLMTVSGTFPVLQDWTSIPHAQAAEDDQANASPTNDGLNLATESDPRPTTSDGTFTVDTEDLGATAQPPPGVDDDTPNEARTAGGLADERAETERAIEDIAASVTPNQRLDINGFDKLQLEALANLAEQLKLNPDLANDYAEGNFPEELAASINLDRLSKYDERLILSLIYLVDPSRDNGGNEFLEVSTITKGHRTDAGKFLEEEPTPEDESEKQSTHYWQRGQAADVSAIDYLRGTEFTLETKSDGTIEVKDELKHLPLKPIDVAWQDDPPALGNRNGTAPRPNGSTIGSTIGNGILGYLLQGLLDGLDKAGADVDLEGLQGHLGSFDNIGELSAQLGEGYIGQALGNPYSLFTGPHALREAGQQALHKAVDGQIPAFGFFGDNLDELFYNSGREIITTNLGLSEGALLGRTSQDVIINAGERFWEQQLGDLPLGTLDGIDQGNRSDLERRIGRGRVAKLLKIEVGSLPLGASPTDVQQALGLTWESIQANGQLISNQLGIPDTDSVALIQSNPDAWFQAIGADTLESITAYHPDKRDAAFNLEQRPTIVELPQGSAVQVIDQLLARYTFKAKDKQLLEQIRAAEASPSSLNTSTRFSSIFPSEKELRAWLLATAYHTTTSADEPQITNRFLAADSTAFFDTGVEVIAKGLAVDNNQRADLRTYLRTGELPDDSVVNLDQVAQQIGFASRDGFESVFNFDAPAVGFSHVGRLQFARIFSSSPEELAALTVKPRIPELATLRQRLDAVRSAMAQLRSDAAIRAELDKGLVATDQLLASLTEQSYPVGEHVPTEWRQELALMHQAAQAAANSSRTEVRGARDLLVALGSLFAPAGNSAYQINEVKLRLPGGQAANRLLERVFAEQASMTDAVEQIGGWAFDDSIGVDRGEFYRLHQGISRARANNNVVTAQSLIDSFVRRNNDPLREAAGVVRLTVGEFATPIELDPNRLVKSIFSGWELNTDLGSRILDAGFGLSRVQPLSDILRTQSFGGTANNAFFESIGLRQITRAITGLGDLTFKPGDVGGAFKSLLYSEASARTGWTIGPNGVEIKNPQHFIESIIGKRLTPQIAQELGITDLSISGLKDFAINWEFYKDIKFTPRLEDIVRFGFPEFGGELPDGFLDTLFNKKLSGEERGERLEKALKGHLKTRLVEEIFNSNLNIPGLPTGSLASAAAILLSDDPAEKKDQALESLGLATADAVMQQQFGFPVSWLVDEKTDTEDKVSIGLRVASRSLNLDPSISNLVESAWTTFFVDGGLDTSTAQGRTELAGLVQSVGSAAGVPNEYATVASAFVTGDVQSTAIAFAGGHFNSALREAGIFNVGFQDFYGAFAGPSKSQMDTFKAEARAEATARLDEPPDIPVIGEEPPDLPIIDEQEPPDIPVIEEEERILQEKVDAYRQQKQENLMFAGMDLALVKSTGIEGLGGLSKAFMKGEFTDQAAAAGNLISGITGSPEAALILGNEQVVTDLKNLFDTGDINQVSDSSFLLLDGWMSNQTGVPIPPGTSRAVLDFTQTGNVGQLEQVIVNPDTLVAFGGGYIDQSLGLPGGATSAMYFGYKQMEAAQQAFDAARLNDFVNNPGVDPSLLGMSETTQQAAQNLGAAQAGLISTGVQLLFGEQIAQLDRQLGLPSGAFSTMINTGIYAAMVPGIGFGSLMMSTVVPWAAPLLLSQVLGFDIQGMIGGVFGLGGGSKTQTIILWSRYRELWPEEVEYDCQPAEEAGQPPECTTGKDIVLEDPDDLPTGVFYGVPPEQFTRAFEAGKREAANRKVRNLLADLLQMPLPEGLDDDNMTPLQIRSHKKEHGELLEPLMDLTWGDEFVVGSYVEAITEGLLDQRKGYLYDEPGKMPVFLDHVHWNF